ncbi:MAG TPA: TIGR03757 family integrating conjugative element protein [Chromatiaceae bacterium]|nr:TIGR03757 family integrating conjugative element protein [Chromatiaceae bacterium]
MTTLHEVSVSRQSAPARFLGWRSTKTTFVLLLRASMAASLASIHPARAEGPETIPAIPAMEQTIEVFTDRAHPLTNVEALPEATVYRIDYLVLMQEMLSEGLPADEEKATRMAKQRAMNIDREAAIRAAEGLAIAHLKYRLDRYPAIVFAGRSVIYGETDLALAKRIYDESGGGEP